MTNWCRISYNMAAEKRPWSDLNLNLRLKLGKNTTFSMASSFATYAYEFNKDGEVIVGDRTEWSYGRFGRWSGYSTSFSYTFNNDTFKKWFGGKSEEEDKKDGVEGNEEDDDMNDEAEENAIPKRKKVKATTDADGYQTFKMPWSLSLNTGFSISEDRSKPINKKTMRYPYKISFNSLGINGRLKLTNKWDISMSTHYDFDAKKISQASMNITRDLHCFTMTATVSPFGFNKYYNFTIRAGSGILQDLKWEQRSQTQSNIQWY